MGSWSFTREIMRVRTTRLVIWFSCSFPFGELKLCYKRLSRLWCMQ